MAVPLVWRMAEDECDAHYIFRDGTVLPGGPQTPEQAVREYLTAAGTPEGVPADPGAYRRGTSSHAPKPAGGEGGVWLTTGSADLHASQMADGWFIDTVRTDC